MLNFERARDREPFFQRAETADRLEDALRNAVRRNTKSMDELHGAVTQSVHSLRDDGMLCEAVLLTIKSCVRHYGRKHRRPGTLEATYSELLMDQIVTWCIQDFYRPE